jgi:hypothetical protein
MIKFLKEIFDRDYWFFLGGCVSAYMFLEVSNLSGMLIACALGTLSLHKR